MGLHRINTGILMKQLLTILFISLAVSGMAQRRLIVNGHLYSALPPPDFTFDSDAQALITATGITDSTYKMRINDLVTQWKDSLPWSSYPAIYPMVGTTAASQKWNLKDPRDLDAAYRLTPTGTVTYSSSGMDFDGSTGYANTFFTPSTGFASNLFHIGVYVNENTAAGDKEEMGSCSSSCGIDVAVLARFSGDAFYPGIGSGSFPSVASTNSIGYWVASRQITANIEGYKNGIRVINSAQTQGRTSNPISLGARTSDAGSRNRFSDRRIAFAVIGPTLTEAQQAIEYRIIDRFRNAVGGGNP